MHSRFPKYVYTVLYIHISKAQRVGNKRNDSDSSFKSELEISNASSRRLLPTSICSQSIFPGNLGTSMISFVKGKM